jgi:putative aminopeptidase FrvX
MEKSSKQFLIDLLNSPSPTGFEQPIQRVVRAHMKEYADVIDTDLHGNVICVLNPDAKRKIMIAGHCDQIGFMVKDINKDGFITLAPLGGIDPGVTPGSHLEVHSKKGKVLGVVGRKPIHLQSADERDKMKLDLEKFWLDIGAKDKKDAEKRVSIGDPITYKLGATELGNNLISSPGLDNKVGLFVTMEALRLCKEAKITNVGIYAVSTVQEEVGLRGARTAAYSIDPEVGFGVDVTFATDDPGADLSKTCRCALGKGPLVSVGPNVNPVVSELLTVAGKKAKIPLQISPENRLLSNDANAIQINKGGVAAGHIGLPLRNMHTQVEVAHLGDLEQSAKLIATFIKGITPKTDFRPM